jgi:hypothetical protein
VSALADALATKNQEQVIGSKIEILVDSIAGAVDVTYSVRLEAPSFSETVLTAQTAQQVADAVLEYTTWAATLWSA